MPELTLESVRQGLARCIGIAVRDRLDPIPAGNVLAGQHQPRTEGEEILCRTEPMCGVLQLVDGILNTCIGVRVLFNSSGTFNSSTF